MGIGYRKSKELGPFRFTVTHRGVSGSAGAGPLRFGRSSSGRRTKSVRSARASSGGIAAADRPRDSLSPGRHPVSGCQ